MNLTGIILAGGKGTRMGNLTEKNHKCLLKIGKFPILAHLIFQLNSFGVNKIVICTGYLSSKIDFYVKKSLNKDLKKLSKILKKKKIKDPKIIINRTKIKDSTSQRIFKAKKLIGKTDLLILYGDSLINLNYKKFQFFIKKNNICDIILSVSNPKEKFGVVKLDKKKVISFTEKSNDKSKWVNSGWIFLKNKILNKIKNIDFNFEHYLFKENLKILAFKNHFYYLPIDNISDLKTANLDWKNNKKNWLKYT